jgi:hypothetical protein
LLATLKDDLYSMTYHEQQENITRVSDVIAPLVRDFYRATLAAGNTWHMEDLTRYVSERTSIAPDSAGRILRDLRQKGHLNYRVVSRSESLYESLAVGAERKPQGSVRLVQESDQYGS